jgi:acetyl-CoA synthetase
MSSIYKKNQKLSQKANLNESLYKKLKADFKNNYYETWAKLAKEELFWKKDFEKIYSDDSYPFFKWFESGETNLSYNCLDTNLDKHANKIALQFINSKQEETILTYQELHQKVLQFANYLKRLGIKKGDFITLYMPLSCEAIIAMLAIVRIGAIHSIVFAGFSATALSERINDTKSNWLLTSDIAYRKGKELPLLDTCIEAHKESNFKNIIVYNRSGKFDKTISEKTNPQINFFNHEKYLEESYEIDPIEWLESESPSFVLYTSGSTGKPKGLVHTTAGYSLWAKLSTKWVFDIKDSDKYWCTADIGWITGHTYLVYGPLLNAATCFFYEDAPDFPNKNIFWQLIEKFKVSIFYTAPTAIRTFMKWEKEDPITEDLSSLRLLGTVGEPINPIAWQWFYETIGKSNCPIVDTWWQTETGGIMVTSLIGIDDMKPGKAGKALPGIEAYTCKRNFLYIKKPFPSLARTINGNPERYHKAYWDNQEKAYLAGDSAIIDKDGYIEIQGRIDDVINVSGHRLGTAEIESSIIKAPHTTEAAVVSIPHEIKGEAIVVFAVTSKEAKKEEIELQIKEDIGSFAKPEEIFLCAGLPKTRSGKIMRRLLKDIAQRNFPKGDISTLEDSAVIEALINVIARSETRKQSQS